MKGRSFSETYTITTGMSLIFTLSVKIRSTGDASEKMKWKVSCCIAMAQHMVVTSRRSRQCPRFFKQAFGGQQCLRTLRSLFQSVILARGKATSAEEMRCRRIQSWKLRSLMYGGLILSPCWRFPPARLSVDDKERLPCALLRVSSEGSQKPC